MAWFRSLKVQPRTHTIFLGQEFLKIFRFLSSSLYFCRFLVLSSLWLSFFSITTIVIIIIIIIVMPQWFDLGPKRLLTFGTSRKGAYSKQGACQGQGSFFFVFAFEKQQNVRNRALMFIWKASSRLGNGFVVPGSILTTTTSQAIIAKFIDKIIRLKELWTHVDIIVQRLRERQPFL